MEIRYFRPIELSEIQNYMDNILDILIECDKEFVRMLMNQEYWQDNME